MNDQISNHLRERLKHLKTTIPTAASRRTARGRMRTCRQLTEHLALAGQLYNSAQPEADRQAVDTLVAEIERRREELSNSGSLARKVLEERAKRSVRVRSRGSRVKGDAKPPDCDSAR